MAVRRKIAETISTVAKRAGLETPVLEELPILAEITALEFAFPRVLGVVPVIVRGKAYGKTAGLWYRVTFPRPVIDPTVVCVAEARRGEIPTVKMPTIRITRVGIAEVGLAEVGLPKLAKIVVPEVRILRVPTALGRFECGWAISGLCDGLNKMVVKLETALTRLNEVIDKVRDGFDNIRSSLESVNAKVDDLRDKANAAVVDLRNKANETISTLRTNVDGALDSLRISTEGSVTDGLGRVIPALYDAWGIPHVMALTAVHIRNVTSTGFEFQSFGDTTVYYIAVGSRR